MERTRLAVVGVGHLGKEHARILSGHPDVQLVGVVDARPEQADAVAERCRTKPYTDYRDLIDRIDAAVIAVPTVNHHAVASDFLNQGVSLLIEKPIAGTVREADDLLYLARENKALVQVGHIERFNPAFEQLMRHSMRPKMVNVQRLAPFSGRSLDIGVVLDLMIHDIDMLLSLVPAPVRHAEAIGVSLLGGNEDLAQARLVFANGCVAHLSASRVHTSAVRRMDVWSAEGYAGVDFHQRRLTLVQPSELLRSLQAGRQQPNAAAAAVASLRLDPYSNLLQTCDLDCNREGPDQLTRELSEFVASVRTGSKVRVSGEQGREALVIAGMILDAIHRHAWEGEVFGPLGPVNLPAPIGHLFTTSSDRVAA
jgi:predicted dehydrogenase